MPCRYSKCFSALMNCGPMTLGQKIVASAQHVIMPSLQRMSMRFILLRIFLSGIMLSLHHTFKLVTLLMPCSFIETP